MSHKTSLAPLILGGVDLDFVAYAVVSPQLLALAPDIIAYNGIGGVQYIGGGTVILFKPYYLSAPVLILKIKYVFNGGAPEAVNALVVVTHNTQIVKA